MTRTLALLAASTALIAVIGAPGWSTPRAPEGATRGLAAVADDGMSPPALLRISGDDDDDDDDDRRDRVRRGHDDDDDDRRDRVRRGHDDDDDDDEYDDDDDDEYDDDDDDDDDDRACYGSDDAACMNRRGSPAPAGSVAPPANGLFGNGAPPVAVTK